jgi:hypothetical protein
LESLDARSDVLIDGPLAYNDLYAQILAQLRPHNAVHVTYAHVPAVTAAGYLAGYCARSSNYALVSAGTVIAGLEEYRERWRSLLAARRADG